MRILWLKTDLLLPLDKGGKLRTWHLLRHLSPRHEITYLAFADPQEPAEHIAGMRDVAAHVETVPRAEVRKASPRFFVRVAWHLFDPLPYAVGQYRSHAYRQRVRQLLSREPFDLVVADFLFPVVNMPGQLPCPAVLFTHNVEAEIWRRHAENELGAARKALYRTQHQRMLRYEGATLLRFDGLLAVSDADRSTFGRLYPGIEPDGIHVVATGVDTEYFTSSFSPEGSTSLVFTGSMDWLPNEDAMLWFCREILPRIRHEVPEVQLTIVGRTPTPAVSRLAADHAVQVTGRVDDVRPFIRDAAVFVVPLRIGGGTRLKIFEAMAMAKAVVSTTVGAEGLPVTHDRNVMLADEPATFARSVIRLLRSVSERRALERAARELVEERFDWSAVARDLDGALVQIAHAHRTPRVPELQESNVRGAPLSQPVVEEKVL